MATSTIEVTMFDNEISILYKWARLLRVPVDLIIVVNNDESTEQGIQYIQGTAAISDLMTKGFTLTQIATELANVNIDQVSIAIMYAITSLTDLNTKSINTLPIERNSSQNLLETINSFLIEHGITEIYNDIGELQRKIEEWSESFTNQFNEDMELLSYMEQYQQELSQLLPLLTSPVSIDRIEIITEPLISSRSFIDTLSSIQVDENFRVPTVEDGIDIFDFSNPSDNVPFIKYNTNDRSLIKLYKGKSVDTSPDYSIIMPSQIRSNSPNTLYITVWSGTGDIKKATKKSYKYGKYNLDTNKLVISSPVTETSDEQLILERLRESLPLTISNITEKSVGGEFFIYDLEILDYILVDMIMNNDLMRSYLFIDEVMKPYAEKARLRIRYRSLLPGLDEETEITGSYIVNPSSVDVQLDQEYARGDEIISIQMPEGIQKFQLRQGQPYVKVKVGRANSRDVLNKFIQVFTRLMNYYRSHHDETQQRYLSLIPDVVQQEILSETSDREDKTKRKGKTANEMLHNTAPDIFVKGYARACQKGKQPIILSPDQVPEWTSQRFVMNGIERNRQVMPFPPDNPRFILACPNDINPFPGVKINNLPNSDQVPCIPCCFASDQLAPESNSNYNRCYSQKDVSEKKTTKESHRTITNKILDPNRLGEIPKAIKDLVSRYSTQSKLVSRLGVVRSPNSLLHCVSLAVDDEAYLNLKTSSERELYVRQIRSVITRQVNPALLKQELYDATLEEIQDQLNNPDIFLDPKIHYRAIEETYNVNIFTFTPPAKNEKDFGNLEIPRYKLFHTRSFHPDRKSILIFKHWGSESDALDYPQCELIIDELGDLPTDKITSDVMLKPIVPKTKNQVRIFEPNMSILLYNAILTIHQVITGNIEDTSYLVERSNIYSQINFQNLVANRGTRQFIDNYGKMRGLIFGSNNTEITILFPASQPENLTTFTELIRSNVDVVVNEFGEPIAVTKSSDMVTGLWYQILDIPFGLYCPVIPTSQFSDKPIGPDNPVFPEGINIISRLKNMRRTLEIFMQVVIWLYELSGLSVDQFVNRYCILGTGAIDSNSVYNLTNIGRKFPSEVDNNPITTVEQGINALRLRAPTLFYQDRLILYSPKFAEGIIYNLNKYAKETEGLNILIPSIIKRSEISANEFRQQKNVAVFVSDDDLKSWLNSIGKTNLQNLVIQTKLNIANSLKTEPYLYMAPDRKIYEIQNVLEGNLLRALNVAYNWYLNKVNMGYQAEPINIGENSLPPYIINGISSSLSPVVIENNAADLPQYLQVLDYGSGQYSAMLELI